MPTATLDRFGDRWARLEQDGTVTTYPQALPELGRSIMRTEFTPNYGKAHAEADIAGAATYFATDVRPQIGRHGTKASALKSKFTSAGPRNNPAIRIRAFLWSF
mmetsp:Transcript_8660/g.21762  ORF Transcript_8660/g.21762 Transcript_8660/m.21762 type:complete len:104 (+) Transcript_8660:238-549(+)